MSFKGIHLFTHWTLICAEIDGSDPLRWNLPFCFPRPSLCSWVWLTCRGWLTHCRSPGTQTWAGHDPVLSCARSQGAYQCSHRCHRCSWFEMILHWPAEERLQLSRVNTIVHCQLNLCSQSGNHLPLGSITNQTNCYWKWKPGSQFNFEFIEAGEIGLNASLPFWSKKLTK